MQVNIFVKINKNLKNIVLIAFVIECDVSSCHHSRLQRGGEYMGGTEGGGRGANQKVGLGKYLFGVLSSPWEMIRCK
jgi:hypothetical protein